MLTTIWLALALQPASIAMHTIPNLPPAIVRAVFAGLCGLLPPPGTDTAEARADRDELAMAAVAALHPADAFEADLAVQIVGANAHAKDSLRLAAAAGQDVWEARRCRAQAAVMMRHMQSGLRALERRQQTREKAEDAMHPAAMGRAGWWFYGGICDFNVLPRHNRIVPGSDHGYGKPVGWRISCHPPSVATSVSIVAAPARQ
jgi:hypothetical protein